jgi:hypothetical protein
LQGWVAVHVFGRSASKRVVVGRSGWLFYADDKSLEDILRTEHFSVDALERWRARIEQRARWLASRGIAYRFVVAPDKHSIYPELLPHGLLGKGVSRLQGLIDYLGGSSSVIDLRPMLLAKKRVAGGQLYFHTDTHWTSYGAYLGYREVMRSLGGKYDRAALEIDDDAFKASGVKTRRDLAIMARLTQVEPDQAPDFGPILACQRQGQLLPPLGLDITALTGFSSRICVGRTESALVFHDSFMQPMMPFVSSQFGRTAYVWGSANDDLFVRMVMQEQPDVVIEEVVERSLRLVPDDRLQNALDKLDDGVRRNYTSRDLDIHDAMNELLRGRVRLTTDTQGFRIMVGGNEWAKVDHGGKTAGSLDELHAEETKYVFKGWAGFPEDKTPANYVIVTAGPDLIFVAGVSMSRPDVGNYFDADGLDYSGFDFAIPRALLLGTRGPIRIFGVKGRKVLPVSFDPKLTSGMTQSVPP